MEPVQTELYEIAAHEELGLRSWTNQDNDRDFYNKIPIDAIRKRAISNGLETCCDLDLVDPQIRAAESILEVGGGYGRVLKGLINKEFTGKISVIEKSAQLYKCLKEQFSYRAEIYHANLMNLKASFTFDLILWLWSGISDFPNDEQLVAMQRLSACLKPKGIFVLDTFPHTTKPSNSLFFQDQSYTLRIGGGTVYGYIPSPTEIKNYAAQVGLKNVSHIPYKTPADQDRLLHLLTK